MKKKLWITGAIIFGLLMAVVFVRQIVERQKQELAGQNEQQPGSATVLGLPEELKDTNSMELFLEKFKEKIGQVGLSLEIPGVETEGNIRSIRLPNNILLQVHIEDNIIKSSQLYFGLPVLSNEEQSSFFFSIINAYLMTFIDSYSTSESSEAIGLIIGNTNIHPLKYKGTVYLMEMNESEGWGNFSVLRDPSAEILDGISLSLPTPTDIKLSTD
ncbi:hypothetical protein P0082_04325 [Candidatus Haliotispira prima]|uniref:Lipoprotein n=1 Tax=Candidatus Haliotispira prima TaxID=3034016 RepID=A0ABY8MLN5_9SPIO|nr:hypothetical protein P0082_04325 [Candidatus Haliotispira prima]